MDSLRAIEQTVRLKGLTVIDRRAAWRTVRSLYYRLSGGRPTTHIVAHLLYRHRTLARLIVDSSDVVVIGLPYFGEALEAAHFHLRVQPTARPGCRLEAIIFLQPPWFSALEKSIQRRVPGDISSRQADDRTERATSRRRVALIAEWATEDWLVRSVEPKARSRIGDATERCGSALPPRVDPFGPAADLLASRTTWVAEDPLRRAGR